MILFRNTWGMVSHLNFDNSNKANRNAKVRPMASKCIGATQRQSLHELFVTHHICLSYVRTANSLHLSVGKRKLFTYMSHFLGFARHCAPF